jgi:DNA-binding NarL/FixJ family response regulator
MHWLEEDEDERTEMDRLMQVTRFRASQRRSRVLIAEHNRLGAEALMFLLDSDPSLEAVGYGLNGWEALELAASHEPDVILVGSGLTGLDQLEFARLVHELFPAILLILLCEGLVPSEAEAAYAIGAADYLPVSRSADELLNAIAAATARRAVFARGQAQARRRGALELVEPETSDG